MKLLLHICCAPCLIYPYEQLTKKDFKVAGLFYNPNIHPLAEYTSRKNALDELNKNLNLQIIVPAYDPKEYTQAINLKETNPGRCALCWRLRLSKTAQAARALGFEYFSTTLLVSPYQDLAKIKTIGEEAAGEAGVKFYYEDFRPGFRAGHSKAKTVAMTAPSVTITVVMFSLVIFPPWK